MNLNVFNTIESAQFLISDFIFNIHVIYIYILIFNIKIIDVMYMHYQARVQGGG